MNGAETDHEMSDAELMLRVVHRDQQSFELLYDRHSPLLYGICLRVLGRPTEAQSVLSDIFYELWERAGQFNPLRGSVRTFLVTLARSRAIDRLRSESTRAVNERHFRATAVGPRPQADPVDGAITQESCELVKQALQGLPDNQRRSLELAYFSGLTHQEIASRLRLPLGSVKTNIRLALLRLKREMTVESNGRSLK